VYHFVYHFGCRALRRARRAVAAAAVAAFAAATAACGSGGPAVSANGGAANIASVTARPAGGPASTAPASTAPSPTATPGGGALAGKSADAIVTQALADTEAASSVRMSAAGTGARKGTMFNLTLVPGQGCEGTLSSSKSPAFRLIYLRQTVWLKPGNAFYASLGTSKAALALLAGKYIKVKSSDTLTGNISSLCSLSGLLGDVGPTAGRSYVATTATFRGQPVVKVTQPGHSGYAYISDTAKPVLLLVTEPGASGGSIEFSAYNVPVTITPPPAAQTVDGSQLGL
jgi:hypothetical protein